MVNEEMKCGNVKYVDGGEAGKIDGIKNSEGRKGPKEKKPILHKLRLHFCFPPVELFFFVGGRVKMADIKGSW